jgi:hypothetical protein
MLPKSCVTLTDQTQPDLDAVLLWGIANGLLQTIANREANTTISTKWYEDRLYSLEQRVHHYEETFNEPPSGYILNDGKVSDFHIPVGGGLYQEAKWIHLNDEGTVSGYLSMQGPNKQPHIINLYIAPDYSVDSPITTLPTWFRHLLTRLGGQFPPPSDHCGRNQQLGPGKGDHTLLVNQQRRHPPCS